MVGILVGCLTGRTHFTLRIIVPQYVRNKRWKWGHGGRGETLYQICIVIARILKVVTLFHSFSLRERHTDGQTHRLRDTDGLTEVETGRLSLE